MKKLLLGFGGLILAGFAYLSLWPVPITPVSWDAPQSKGYVGAFAPNTKLANLERLSIGDYHGPEDVVSVMENGAPIIYTSSQDGVIVRIETTANTSSVFATTGGRPLGMEADNDGNLIVADAYKGLLSISKSGEVTVLTNTVDGSQIAYADDLDVAKDGTIYFSDASVKFGAEAAGSTLAASLLEIMEMGKTGRVLAYDPASQNTRVVAAEFSFANGVAMCPDDACLLVIETGTYSVKRIGLGERDYGQVSTVIDNLPGFPDNINRGADGTFWVGLISKRSDWLDDNSAKPKTRAMAMRLPAALRPKAQDYGHVFQMDAQGNVLQVLQDPSGAYPATTGAIEGVDGYLYITSLAATDLARRKLP